MRLKSSLIFCFCLLILSGCDSGFEQLESGFLFRKVESFGGEGPKDSQAVKVHMKIAIDDSLVVNSEELFPTGRRLAMNNMWPDFKDVLMRMGKGDSVQVKMTLPDYAKLEGRTTPLKDSAAVVTMSMRVLDVDDEAKLIEKMVKDQFDYEVEQIEKYLVNNNLEAERTEEGVYYIISREGEGDYIKVEDEVVSRFTIRLLEGKVLGTTDEDVARENGIYTEKSDYSPYLVNLAKPRTLESWLQVVPRFKAGSKGTIITPSRFAYGSRGAAGIIPPNATLVYDLEILEIK